MPMRLPLEVRLYASAMLTTLRSWRPTIGRIPTAAAVSIILLAGKQKTVSTPSRRSTSATAWLPFMPRSLHRVERRARGRQPQAARGQDPDPLTDRQFCINYCMQTLGATDRRADCLVL